MVGYLSIAACAWQVMGSIPAASNFIWQSKVSLKSVPQHPAKLLSTFSSDFKVEMVESGLEQCRNSNLNYKEYLQLT